ncbi:MAG: SDR family oxidoreductase [Elusimicrobiota bacterium]|nr:SDR family oxidoreductase [Elusimicrobiota bacterium]
MSALSGGVLVIGGTGLVGNALVRAWTARGRPTAGATYHCHPGPGFRRLDMQDEAAVRACLAELEPGVVAVPAANPHVDYCETHPEETRRVNVTGTLNVARAARDAGSRVVFYSSDYVFDGVKGSYSEDDPPNPLNEYGRQKAEAEAGVLGADPRNLVIRTSGAYGWQWEPKNFVLQVRARLSAGQPMSLAGDLLYNPTYAENLAEVTADLVESGAAGIFHVVGAEAVTRYDFAVMAAETWGLDAALLESVPAARFTSPTPRPKQSCLLTAKVRAAAKTPLMGPAAGLAHMKALEPAWRAYAKTLPSPSL